MATGYWAGLEVMRRWLYPDAAVDGRRSVIAGFMSPVALFILWTFSTGLGAWETLILFGLIGFVMAVLMFFAWLTPTPDEKALLTNGLN